MTWQAAAPLLEQVRRREWRRLDPEHVIALLCGRADYRVVKMVSSYYPEFAWLSRIPILREVLTWNCALLLEPSS